MSLYIKLMYCPTCFATAIFLTVWFCFSICDYTSESPVCWLRVTNCSIDDIWACEFCLLRKHNVASGYLRKSIFDIFSICKSAHNSNIDSSIWFAASENITFTVFRSLTSKVGPNSVRHPVGLEVCELPVGPGDSKIRDPNILFSVLLDIVTSMSTGTKLNARSKAALKQALVCLLDRGK